MPGISTVRTSTDESSPSTVRGLAAIQWTGVSGTAVLTMSTHGIPVPRVVALAAGLVAMAVVVLAWLQLGRRIRRVGVPARRLYWIGASWALPLLVSRPLFSGDIHSYLAQGVIAAAGLDPFTLGPEQALGAHSAVTEQVSGYWRDTPAPYGPVFVALERAVAGLAGENLVTTVLLHRILELAGIALIAWALPRLARRMGVPESGALWLGLLNPLVLWHVVAGIHNDGLMVGLLLAGVLIALHGLSTKDGATRLAWVAAGAAVLGVAASVKLVAAAALGVIAAELARRWGGRFRHALAAAVCLLAVFAAVTIVLSAGTGLGFGWFGNVHTPGQVHSWLAPTNQLGFLVGGIGALLGADITATAITVGKLIGLVLGALAAGRIGWLTLRGRMRPLLAIGLLFAVIVVFGPAVQPWYLLWTVVPLAAVVWTDRARRRLAGLSAVLAVLLPPVGGGAGVLVAGYAVGAAVLALAWGVARMRRRRVLVRGSAPGG